MLVRRDPEHVARILETVDLLEDDGAVIPRLSARFLSHRVSTTAISASTLMTELWIRL
jgi:hypothetical protein